MQNTTVQDHRDGRATPRACAAAAEHAAAVPAGDAERCAGYGVIGLRFASGHVLGLRRWPASSLGTGYTSVWHRDPAGRWTFHADAAPRLACPRYTGRLTHRVVRTDVHLAWMDPRTLEVKVPEAALEWRVRLTATPAKRLLGAVAALRPDFCWRDARALRVIGAASGLVLGAGPTAARDLRHRRGALRAVRDRAPRRARGARRAPLAAGMPAVGPGAPGAGRSG